MIRIKNATYRGSNDRPALYDLTIPADFNGHLIVFIHGYMGFKDWGAWNNLSNYFTENGFGFSKFNLTHNGTTIAAPYDFKDLEQTKAQDLSNSLGFSAIINNALPLSDIFNQDEKIFTPEKDIKIGFNIKEKKGHT